MLATESGARRGGEVKRRNADSSVWTACQSPEGLRHTLGGGRRVGKGRETEETAQSLWGGGGGAGLDLQRKKIFNQLNSAQSVSQSGSQFSRWFFWGKESIDEWYGFLVSGEQELERKRQRGGGGWGNRGNSPLLCSALLCSPSEEAREGKEELRVS